MLARSEKLVPSRGPVSWAAFYRSCDDFRAAICRYSSIRMLPPQADSLAGLRRPFFRPVSAWCPSKEHEPAGLDEFCDNVRAELAFKLQLLKKRKFRSNLSIADRYGPDWLKNNRTLINYSPPGGTPRNVLELIRILFFLLPLATAHCDGGVNERCGHKFTHVGWWLVLCRPTPLVGSAS